MHIENSIIRRLGLLVVCGAMACVAAAAPPPAQEGTPAGDETAIDEPPLINLVQNGDFEEGPNGRGGPALWSDSFIAESAGDVAFAWDDSVAHHGRRSVSIAIEESYPEKEFLYNWNQFVLYYVPGATYRVSAWVRTENITESPFVMVQCLDRAMQTVLNSVTSQDSVPVVGSSDWTEVGATLTIPAETGRMVVAVGLNAPANRGGRAWFDDVSFLPVKRE